jgi:hypothetical protein
MLVDISTVGTHHNTYFFPSDPSPIKAPSRPYVLRLHHGASGDEYPTSVEFNTILGNSQNS